MKGNSKTFIAPLGSGLSHAIFEEIINNVKIIEKINKFNLLGFLILII